MARAWWQPVLEAGVVVGPSLSSLSSLSSLGGFGSLISFSSLK
jgi:hypothetical protein